ncbi:MAG: DUF2812 domain-containing protein [Bacilli bacterium]
MDKVVRRWFWVWDFEKEEAWLNEMAAKGMLLKKVGLCKYVFQEGAPNLYTYRLQMLSPQSKTEDADQYIAFLKEQEIEHVGQLFRWAYFRKRTEGLPFQLFSDIDSRIGHMKGILQLLFIALFLNLGFVFVNMMNHQHEFRLIMPLVNLSVVFLSGYGIIRCNTIVNKLSKERNLHE